MLDWAAAPQLFAPWDGLIVSVAGAEGGLLSEYVPSRSGRSSSSSVDIAERIHGILASKGVTLYQASQQSSALYGKSSPYFLPHNLYYDLRHEPFTPSIFQVFALSHISGYRISDWLRTFGIDLENIPRLQSLLPRKRTALIDTPSTDVQSWVPWFRTRAGQRAVPAIGPLTQLLERIGPRRICSLPGADAGKFLYAKVGTQDALAFPDLLPTSLVRADPKLVGECLPPVDGRASERVFLLEHSNGLFCSRVRRVRENIIVPVGTEFSYAQVELKLASEAILRGVVDFEIRPLVKPVRPEVPNELAKLWKPTPLYQTKTFHQLLITGRMNAGLSFREAALEAQRLSEMLDDDRYRISASSICDYETQGTPPRGLHKIATLCCIYGLTFGTFLRAIGIPVEQAGSEAMLDRSAAWFSAQGPELVSNSHSGFLESLLEIWDEVPFFLRDAIGPSVGLRELSIDDLFWIGGDRHPLHPNFANALLAIVNRRRKTPFHFPSKPLWKQPVFLLLQREGTYLCACCDVENSTLVIHPYTEHVPRTMNFHHRKDIEVVGQIVAIARRMT